MRNISSKKITFAIITSAIVLAGALFTNSSSQTFAADFEPDCRNQEAIVPAGFGRAQGGIARAYYRVKNCGFQPHSISAVISSGICQTQTGSCTPTKQETQSISVKAGEYYTFTAPVVTATCGSVQTDIEPQGLPSHGEYEKLADCATPAPVVTPNIVAVAKTPQPAVLAQKTPKTLPSTGGWEVLLTSLVVVSVSAVGFKLRKFNL